MSDNNQSKPDKGSVPGIGWFIIGLVVAVAFMMIYSVVNDMYTGYVHKKEQFRKTLFNIDLLNTQVHELKLKNIELETLLNMHKSELKKTKASLGRDVSILKDDRDSIINSLHPLMTQYQYNELRKKVYPSLSTYESPVVATGYPDNVTVVGKYGITDWVVVSNGYFTSDNTFGSSCNQILSHDETESEQNQSNH